MRRWRDRVRQVLQEAGADERGLVTAEWVMLVAGLFVAAVAITGFVMNVSWTASQSHEARAGEVDPALDTVLEGALDKLPGAG